MNSRLFTLDHLVAAIRVTVRLWNIARSLRLDAGELDYLAPLLGFLRDQLAEVGGRARQRRTPHVGKARLERGVAKRGVDLLVELVDDVGWRGARRADAGPEAKLIARHEFGNRREVRQRVRTRRGGDCERAKFAGPDVSDRRGHGGEHDLHLPA